MRSTIVIVAIIAAVLAAWLALPILPVFLHPSQPSPPVQPQKSLAVIATSGFESAVFPAGLDGSSGTGGLAATSGEIARIRGVHDGTLVFSTGNDMMGAWYSLFGGEPEYGAMSIAGYDAACPGNHEFDRGSQIYAGAVQHAAFPLVCSNLEIDDPALRERIVPATILNLSGVRAGIFGLITPELPRISKPGTSVRVNPDIAVVSRQSVQQLRAKNASIIILLSNAGITADRELARTVDGIDIIVTSPGNDALFENITGPAGKRCMLMGGGLKGGEIGVLSFSWDGKGMRDPGWEAVPVTSASPADSRVQSFLAPFQASYEARFGIPLAISNSPLEARDTVIRSQETNLGDLVTDAMLSRFTAGDAAIINSGGIRGDRVWPAGNVSFRMISEILPFGNSATLLTVDGRTLHEILEISAATLPQNATTCTGGRIPDQAGFLQMGGLKVTIDPSAQPFCAVYNGTRIERVIQPGNRIREVTVFRYGEYEPLDPDLPYTLVVPDFIADGGDGYAPLAAVPGSNRSDTRITIADILADYLVEKNPVTPITNDRITILHGSPASAPTAAPSGNFLTLQVSPVNYTPAMSSTPGMKLTARCQGNTSGGTCIVRWKCSSGHFLFWNPPDFQVHEDGNETTPVSGPVYWTYSPGDIPLPGVVRVSAASDSGAAASLAITIDGHGYATVGAMTG